MDYHFSKYQMAIFENRESCEIFYSWYIFDKNEEKCILQKQNIISSLFSLKSVLHFPYELHL